MYLDEKENVIQGKSEDGHPAAGVPGSVAGIFAYYKYASLPFGKLIQPAIDLAETGFRITTAEANDLNENQDDFKKYNTVAPVFVKMSPGKQAIFLSRKISLKLSGASVTRDQKDFTKAKQPGLLLKKCKEDRGLSVMGT